ncbi:MAG TPA: LysM peptidoglycan-binding domain-containing protein [Actinomycetes bacterium]
MSTITVSAALHRPRVPARRIEPADAPLRLTRRGRLLVTALTLLLLVVAGVLASGGVPAVAGSEPGSAATAQRVTVRPGETLWAIAERAAPGTDPRATIAEIMDLNALESSSVAAGSVLLLPPR